MKKRILLLLLFIAHTFGNLFNDYMSNLKLENYSEEDRYAIKPFLENMYTVKEKNFQEIRKKFYQTRTETTDWKFRKNLDEESGNTDGPLYL
ncbi:hypothetical protein Avbf_09365 [Armadillidium vulgare]|nr:hypothetical protein Avbf_09365 [Armadillidium vulgare]